MRQLRFLILSLVFLSSLAFADAPFTLAKLNVRGEAVLEKPADQFELTLGVVTQAKLPDLALQNNNQQMQQVIDSLKTLGFDHEDYQTGHFRIEPVYRVDDKNSDHEEQEQRMIDHYEVVNSIQIKSQKLHLADQVINLATKNGANQIHSINFNLTSPQAYRAEAIEAAVQNAFHDAQVLAQAAHVRLVKLLEISLDQPQNHFYRSMAVSMAKGESSQTPLEAGTIDVRASVQVVFEIAP